MEFLVTTDQTCRRTDEVVTYLTGPRLWIPQADYPDYDAWIEKVHEQLRHEHKRAILALCRNRIVGAVVYQKHLTEPDALEIKNITVRPDMQGRYVASFLLRNAEIEGAQDFGVRRALLDAKVRNTAIRTYLFKHGYRPLVPRLDLYGLGAGEDVVYTKLLARAAV